MKRLKPEPLLYRLGAVLLTVLFVIISSDCRAQKESGESVLRIVSYNIQRGEGMDGKIDYKRIAGILAGLDPAVVAVQEVDSMTGRTHNTYSLGEIAKMMDYHAVYAPNINYDGGKYGIGILSRHKPQKTRQYMLPGKDEARSMVVAEFENYVFACTHLSLEEQERMESLSIIRSVAKGYDKPFIIAGDWNDLPDSPFIRAMEQDFCICSNKQPSWPAGKPEECLDYVAVYRGNVVAETAGVVANPVASDHRPIFVELELKNIIDK